MTNNSLNVFNVIDTDIHRRKRKIISQPIEGRALKEFEPTIIEQIDIFISQVHAASVSGQHVNMSELCPRLGIDIIGHLAFGYSLNLQTEDTYRFLPPAFDLGRARINLFMPYPPLTILDRLIKYLTRSKRERILAMLRTIIAARTVQDKNAKPDFYSFASGNMDEGSGDFENSELWAEATFFVTAGGTPPATTMCALLFYITQSPNCYALLASEIRTTFQSGKFIKGGPLLASCRYLRACIDEALRLAPPTLATLWREQNPKDADTSPLIIDGRIIPKGTHVGVSIYALHHNEAYFSDPFAFRPERWIEANNEEHSRMNMAFIPFITGPRSCVGKGMTYLEVSVAIAKLIWYFDFERATGSSGQAGCGNSGRTDGRGRADEYQLFDVFSAMHDGPNLVFRPRNCYTEEMLSDR